VLAPPVVATPVAMLNPLPPELTRPPPPASPEPPIAVDVEPAPLPLILEIPAEVADPPVAPARGIPQ
jgi:hypothetical protein